MPKKNDITFDSTYENRPIMTDQAHGLGCCKPILRSIKSQFDNMLERHNKVFFMRYDIRFPRDSQTPADNRTLCTFQADFIKKLTRKSLDPHYVVTREQSKEKHQHYHGILLLDGNRTQSIRQHIDTAEQTWRKKLDLPPGKGLIDDCTRDRDGNPQQNGIMLRRDDPEYEEKINRCFHWSSYIAKENQKANTPEGQRQLFASRIKKK